MSRDKQPYFAPDTEHKFGERGNNSNNNHDNDNKIDKLLANLNAELGKVVKEEAREKIMKKMFMVMSILAREMKKEYEEKIEIREQELNEWASALPEKIEREYDKKKKQEKKYCWMVVSAFFGWIIIVAFLFQYFLAKIIFVGTAILGVVGSVSSFIFESYPEIAQKVAHIRGDKESYSTGIVKSAKALAEMIKKASLLHLALLLCVATFLGALVGSVGIFEMICEFAAAAYTVAMTEEENVFSEVQVDKEVLAVITAGCDEKTINMLQQADITQEELDAVNELSQQDRDWVFELNQMNIDWTDQDDVNAAVLQMLDDKTSMKTENVFDKDVNDGGAPQWQRNLVAQASEDEITAESFSDIKAIRDVRADAYNLYPKKSLANLLSNNYQKLAIILWLHGGEEESIIYYYGQSILMDFECLQFAQNSNATIKDKLNSIAQRYKDMIYTCPNMENIENAQALAKAFENAANQY